MCNLKKNPEESKRKAVAGETHCLLSTVFEKLQKTSAQERILEKSHRNICVEPYSILKFLTQELPSRFCIRQILTYLSTVNMATSASTRISFWHLQYPPVTHLHYMDMSPTPLSA